MVGRWGEWKGRLKRAAINKGKAKGWEERLAERRLVERLGQVGEGEGDERERVKAELRALQRRKTEAAALRAKVDDLLYGEKYSAYFLGLEKSKQERQTIAALTTTGGRRVVEEEEIEEEVVSFYQALYKDEKVDTEGGEGLVGGVKGRLSVEASRGLEGEVREEEVARAIQGLARRKSPGEDGLPAELYVALKTKLVPVLTSLFNEMVREGKAPEGFAQGIITLLYKNIGSREDIKNYRPISLLNTDYKILAKIIANRLKEVAGDVVTSLQAYGIPGRDISDAVLTIQAAVRGMGEEGGCLLSLDLEKAFDRVNHVFLFQVLAGMGFGVRVQGLIGLLYMGAKSKVKLNGRLTRGFSIGRSVRQGCPLSPLLFSFVMETLVARVERDGGLRGLPVAPGAERVKVVPFADDVTLLASMPGEVDRILEHVNAFEEASGAKLNRGKTGMLGVGWENVGRWGFKVAEGNLKILGIHVGIGGEDVTRANWGMVISRVQSTVNRWRLRGLSLRGKVIVWNSLVASKIVHVLGTCELPQWALKALNDALSSFLWRGRANSIARRVLINGKREGGLGLFDVAIKRDALRVKILRKFLDWHRQYSWEGAVAGWLAQYGEGDVYNLCTLPPRKAYCRLPCFFQEVLEAWAKVLPSLKPMEVNKSVLLKLPFLQTPFFQSGGRALTCAPLRAAGVTRIGQVVNRVGMFDVVSVLSTLRAGGINYRAGHIRTTGDRLDRAMPGSWRGVLTSGGLVAGEPRLGFLLCLKGGSVRELSGTPTRVVARLLTSAEGRRPTSERAWGAAFPDADVGTIWGNLCIPLIPHACHDLDFKIRHRGIFTGVILHQIHKELFSRTCVVCKSGDEDLMHLFVTCKCLSNLHVFLSHIIDGHCRHDIPAPTLTPWTILFGTHRKHTLVNTILTLGRSATWTARNLQLHEHKHVCTIQIVKRNIRQHLRTLQNTDGFNALVEGSTFCVVDEFGELSFCFDDC